MRLTRNVSNNLCLRDWCRSPSQRRVQGLESVLGFECQRFGCDLMLNDIRRADEIRNMSRMFLEICSEEEQASEEDDKEKDFSGCRMEWRHAGGER